MTGPSSAVFIDLWSTTARAWRFLDPRWQMLLIFLVSLLLAGGLVVSVLGRITQQGIDAASLFSLGLSGGILTLIALSLTVFTLSAWIGKTPNFKVLFLLFACGLAIGIWVLHRRSGRSSPAAIETLLLLVFLFFGLLWMRLAFIRDLVMPSYSDSVEHFQIIDDLLHPESPAQAFYTLARIPSRYYHFGFHALAGWTTSLSDIPIPEVMLVLGQILQAVIPVSLFFLVKTTTKSGSAGLLSGVLAGLAWRMPAYASNWGKYPALAGIATLPFALGMLGFAASTAGRKERLKLALIALAGGWLSALAHTRTLLLLVLAAGSWWIASRVLASGSGRKIIAVAVFASLTVWLGILVFTDSSLDFMLAPYLREGLLPTLLVVMLIPYALKHYPRPTVSALLFLLFLLAGTLIPLPEVLARYGYQALLDRPFIQIVLFLPLALLGGVGFAGLKESMHAMQWEERRRGSMRRLWITTAVLCSLALSINAVRVYGISPSSCCRLVTEDDLAAFAWIQETLPADAVILIASNRTPTRSFGVDGGIWITPLTGYRTEKWPYNTPLDSPVVLEQMCDKGATHIYAGGTTSRFQVEIMEINPIWYENLFTRPGAYIYEIIGCSTAPN